MKTDYEKQASDFLTTHGIKFRATLADSKTPPWKTSGEKSGHHYRVTLSKSQGSPVCHPDGSPIPRRLTFDFWASVRDAEQGILTVTPYDVLACISSDANYPETFSEFCAEFGDSEDSIKALQSFRRCAAFGKRLRAFFTAEEIAALAEIN